MAITRVKNAVVLLLLVTLNQSNKSIYLILNMYAPAVWRFLINLYSVDVSVYFSAF